MEDYITFASPNLLDLNNIIMWVFIVGTVASIVLFSIWSIHHHRVYPVLSTIFSVFSICIMVLTYFAGPFYNSALVGKTVAEDYGVIVTNIEGYQDVSVTHLGNIYECQTSALSKARYFVVCDSKGTTVFLNDLINEPVLEVIEE